MEKPYRYLKKLIEIGNSSGIIIPAVWLRGVQKKMNLKKVVEVIVEVYKDKIVISPQKQRMDATTIFNKSESSVKLMKMSKGYQWEIKIYGPSIDEILQIVKETDTKLKAQFEVI